MAPVLADRAYWGTPAKATTENWAFAFSCKKKWKAKAEEDIAKVAGLPRRFSKVYFITNQFVSDKARSDFEQEQQSKHGFEVHLLDRNWIVSRVIEHAREQIAVECLGITAARVEQASHGPRDVSRLTELKGLETRLASPAEFYASDYFLAADYRRAAMLSRGLERPRHETDGLFKRAEQLAHDFGDVRQIIRCGYDHAWTSLWWFDDPRSVAEIYTQIEPQLESVRDAEDCELFGNLLTLLRGACTLGRLNADDLRLDERWGSLDAKLNELAAEKERPNNVLYAETLFWQRKLFAALLAKGSRNVAKLSPSIEDSQAAETSLETACAKLDSCLSRSRGLTTYPLMATVDYIKQFGEFVDGIIPAYESLFSKACEVIRERGGEREEGQLILERGLQLAERGVRTEALLMLGKARVLLAKEESIQDSARAALACCDAYLWMGLFWAARMEALIAAIVSMRLEGGKLANPLAAFLASKRMCICELRLGRVAPSSHGSKFADLRHHKSMAMNSGSKKLSTTCVGLNSPSPHSY